ncbi:MAG TPA: hypothetical protein PKZ07_05280 [Sedimentisphaerales bacterium]|nr:hypothetical protein [Sedimentisphaerales bacterium]
MRFPDHSEVPTSFLGRGIPAAWPFLVKGPAAVLEATIRDIHDVLIVSY